VAVNGNYAYVTDVDSGLWVISISDQAHPTKVGHCELPDTAYSVAVTGHLACIADYIHGLRVVSVADPANPVEVGHDDTLGAISVTASGNYAYVGSFEDGLYVISLADSAHPVQVGRCNTHEWVGSAAIYNNYAYAIGYSRLYVISVSDPPHADTVGHYLWLHAAVGVAADADYAYVTSDSGLGVYQFYGAGIEERKYAELRATECEPTVVRGVLFLAEATSLKLQAASLLDISGRKVMDLHPGANGVSMLAPGVYFVMERSAVSGERSATSTRKVIITR